MHKAAGFGYNEIIQLLIDEGAEVNAADVDGDTPMDYANQAKQNATANLLQQHGGKTADELKEILKGSIHDAAISGEIEAVKLHLANGADVNARDDGGITPLLYAVWEGHKEIVELLLANGADTSAKNPDGQTPLDLAIEYDDTEIIDLLRKHQEPEPMPRLIYSKDKLTINVPFDFRFTAKAGKSYTVEATRDLLKWNKVETISGTGSEVKFTDTRKALFEMQYYRVKLVD